MKTIAGVKRNRDYSPNHIENDSLIFMKTVEEIKQLGLEVNVYDEEELEKEMKIKEDLIFSMARGALALRKLLKAELEGKMVINSPLTVLKCHRINMSKLLKEAGVPFPFTVSGTLDVLTDYKFDNFNSTIVWVKRGDIHAIHREDVTLVFSEEEKRNILKEFGHRGIASAVLQKHIEGEVVKFYAIKDTGFFDYFFYNRDKSIRFDENKLKLYTSKAAEVLGLEIYGGDAIISESGEITIIDMNDWPSFAPVRDKASKYIAKYIYRKLFGAEERTLI
ncbi:hypothetical protein ACSSWA_10795 [Melioribacter sp. Ez-97]|uniref:hypothetical protein n=1 Tax=Melioribacter sp. Ez-97 TaxID=3423434 RepID=UPI003ED9F3F7